MRVYYFDDSGSRIPNNPKAKFFVLGGFGIDDSQIPFLQREIRTIAKSYGMDIKHPVELKFQHVATLKDTAKENDHNHAQWMLRAGIEERNRRRALVYSCLRAALRTPSAEAICVGVNTHRLNPNESAIAKALTPLLERVQMNCQDHDSSGLVMMDEEQKDNKALREFLRNGSPYFKYDRLLDSLAFMPSQESVGIQIADLIAGGFSRHINYGDPGYLRTFLKSAATHNGTYLGCGIKLYHSADQFVPPANRPRDSAWSPTDKEIHDFEFEALLGEKARWNANGAPEKAWLDDWDFNKK